MSEGGEGVVRFSCSARSLPPPPPTHPHQRGLAAVRVLREAHEGEGVGLRAAARVDVREGPLGRGREAVGEVRRDSAPLLLAAAAARLAPLLHGPRHHGCEGAQH